MYNVAVWLSDGHSPPCDDDIPFYFSTALHRQLVLSGVAMDEAPWAWGRVRSVAPKQVEKAFWFVDLIEGS